MRFYLHVLLIANVLTVYQTHAISFGWVTRSVKAIGNVTDVMISKAIDQINFIKLFELETQSTNTSTDALAVSPDKVEAMRNVPVKELAREQLTNLYEWAKNNPDEALKKAGLYTIIGAVGIGGVVTIDENRVAIKNALYKHYNENPDLYKYLYKWSAGVALGALATTTLYYVHKSGMLANLDLPIPAGDFLTANARTIAKVTAGGVVGASVIGVGILAASFDNEPALVIACTNLLKKSDSEFESSIKSITNHVNQNFRQDSNDVICNNVRQAIFGNNDYQIIGALKAARNWKEAHDDATKNNAKEEFDRQVQELKIALRLPNL